MKIAIALAVLLAVASGPALAADLKLLAGGGIARPLDELARQFEATGHQLAIRYGTTPDLIKMAVAGEPFDAVVVPREVFADPGAKARVADPLVEIAHVGLGVAVRAGASKPDVATAAALGKALLEARSIATVPASAAGAQVMRLLDRLGVADAVKPRIKAFAGPGPMVQAVALGEAELGLFLINVLTAPGLDVVGPVPAGLSQDIVYLAGIARDTQQAAAARAFLDFLRTQASRDHLTARGMTPP